MAVDKSGTRSFSFAQVLRWIHWRLNKGDAGTEQSQNLGLKIVQRCKEQAEIMQMDSFTVIGDCFLPLLITSIFFFL